MESKLGRKRNKNKRENMEEPMGLGIMRLKNIYSGYSWKWMFELLSLEEKLVQNVTLGMGNQSKQIKRHWRRSDIGVRI